MIDPQENPTVDLFGVQQRTARNAFRGFTLLILAVAFTLASCSGSSGATTARFETMLPFSEDGEPTSDFLLVGLGDFATGELSYTSFLGHQPYEEHLDLGVAVTYVKYPTSPKWNKRNRNPRVTAITSLRNRLVASMNALEYLKSVSEEVTTVGTETVRQVKTTHYRASGDLGRPETDSQLPVDVWIDEDGRTRRFLYRNLELWKEYEYVTEFYGFGVSVDDIEPPPPDKVF